MEYIVEIIETSKELTAKERVMLKKHDAQCLDKIIVDDKEESKVIVDLDYYAHLHIKNENSDDKEYEQYVFYDKNGSSYYTGSETVWREIGSIMEEMEGVDEDYKLVFYKRPSSKRDGKFFITANII